jgi:hypothetical protein
MMSDTAGSLPVSFGGHSLRIVSDVPQIFQAIRTHLCHCPAQADEPPIVELHVTTGAETKFTISADGSPLFSNFGYDLTLQALMTEAVSRLVSVCERGLVIHAGALAQDGKAVILSAQGGSGKSTLAAWLTADGLQYLTDEVIEIPLDMYGAQVNTFPRSIFLKKGSAFVWKQRLNQTETPRFLRFADDAAWIDPQLFQPAPPASISDPRLLVFPRYVPGAVLEAQRLTTAETLFRVMQNVTNARNLPRHGLDAATRLAQRVTAYALTYSDLNPASEWVQKTLQAS